MPYRLPAPDPDLERALGLMARLGCSFGVLTFNPGPGNPPCGYPLQIHPPPGFHFEDGQHFAVLQTWWDVVERLLSMRIVACSELCGDADLRPKP